MTNPTIPVDEQILRAKQDAVTHTKIAMLRECISDLCEIMQITIDDRRRELLSSLDLHALEYARVTIKETWAWPFHEPNAEEHFIAASKLEQGRQQRYDRSEELNMSLEAVTDATSLLAFITLLTEERHAVEALPMSSDGHKGRWANHSISTYLDAALSCTQAHIENGTIRSDSPWKFFAHFLYAGRIYE